MIFFKSFFNIEILIAAIYSPVFTVVFTVVGWPVIVSPGTRHACRAARPASIPMTLRSSRRPGPAVSWEAVVPQHLLLLLLLLQHQFLHPRHHVQPAGA